MKQIQVLDCTLRDGGYVNHWQFEQQTITDILRQLTAAKIDIIECGYLSQTKPSNPDSTIFNTISTIQDILPEHKAQYACMINYGEFNVNQLPDCTSNSPLNTLRIAFHKNNWRQAMDDCLIAKQKGYHIFVQPMVTANYTDDQLNSLIIRANDLLPDAVYIVDSFGTMRKKDLIHLFHTFDKSLNPVISIGFHSHNNLQLSFSNAQELISTTSSRNLIIDSSVFGMGRGAGNLCTELLTLYLNENNHTSYNLVPILDIIDKHLNTIFITSPWGYSVPYYLAAINNCHPNYAGFLTEKATLGVTDMNNILAHIQPNDKTKFNQKVIEQLYQQYQNHTINDTLSKENLRKQLTNRQVLLLAPGKSIKEQHNQIEEFIRTNNPIVIAVNFLPELIQTDYIFISNAKRYQALSATSQCLIITSNISAGQHNNIYPINYNSLIDTAYSEPDNAGMMSLRLLYQIGIRNVTLAGFDGYTPNLQQNYASRQLILNANQEIIHKRNHTVKAQIDAIRCYMQIHFLTPSLYE